MCRGFSSFCRAPVVSPREGLPQAGRRLDYYNMSGNQIIVFGDTDKQDRDLQQA